MSVAEIMTMVKRYGSAVDSLSIAQIPCDGPCSDGSYNEDEAREKIKGLLAAIKTALEELEGK